MAHDDQDLSLAEKGVVSDEKNKINPSTGATPSTEANMESSIQKQEPDDRNPADAPLNSDSEQGPRLEKWNEPRIHKYRYFGTILGLLIMGMNDSCIGALLPYIERYYDIDYTIVSTLFIVPFVGYLIAGLSNNMIHHRFGQRGVAFLGPICRLIGYITMSQHPPFPVLPVMLLFSGFGNGIEDSAWNAWVGNMEHANELLGFIHGAYGLGGTISPLIASAMVTKAGLQWYTYFYIMIGVTIFEGVYTLSAFWTADGAAYRKKISSEEDAEGSKPRVTTRQVLSQPITWLIALFLLGYVGAEVSLGGWIVSFMLQVRHAQPFLAGLTVTFFWLGLTIGRVGLGFITGRIGEKLAITVYLGLSIVLELLYWLVPSFAASIVFVILLGAFLGPLFPACVVAATKLLPAEAHVSAVGFAAAFGGGGAAIFPFAVGAIAQKKGVSVLQPIVVAIFVCITVLWLSLPGGFKKGGLERAREEKERPGADLKRMWRIVTRKDR